MIELKKKIYIYTHTRTVKYISRIDVIIVNDDEGFDTQKAEKLLRGYVKQLDDVDRAAGVMYATKKFFTLLIVEICAYAKI